MVRRTLELSLLAALRKSDFAAAIDLVHQNGYRTARSASEMRTQWAIDAHKLSLIFSSKPILFDSIPEDVLEQLRLVAGMQYLLNESAPPQIVKFGDEFVPGTQIKSQFAPGLLIKHVEYLISLEQYHEHAQQRPSLLLTIRHANDHAVCPSCKRLADLRFKIENVYELPNPLCTCEMGCRCKLLPVLA